MSLAILFIRTTNLEYDSRLQKSVQAASKIRGNCIVLGWDRDAEQKTFEKKDDEKSLKILNFSCSAKFGGGIKSLFKFLKFNFWIAKQMFILRKEYDTVHACDLDTGLMASVMAKMLKKKLIYDIYDYYIHSHHIPTKLLTKIVENLEASVIKRAESTIICSDQRKEQISKANPKKLYVIYNTPNLNNLSSEVTKNDKDEMNKLKVVFVGMLLEHRFILEAIESIGKDLDFELYIGGYGILENKVSDKSLEFDNVNYLGKLTYEKTLELEKSADILFAIYDPEIPNHRYSAPNKIYEAMGLGKPIIVAKNTGIDEMIEFNNCGLAVDYSEEGFKNALELLKNNDLRTEQGENGKRIYEEKYSWGAMEKKYEEIYDN